MSSKVKLQVKYLAEDPYSTSSSTSTASRSPENPKTSDKNNIISYAHPQDAGIDLRSAESTTIFSGERKTISCGIAISLPQNTVGMVCPRSGLASKYGITIVNAPGIVDAGYRGEVKVVLLNTGNQPFKISRGDRIAQLVVVPFIECKIVEVENLGESDRGEEGFGSSGVK